MSRFSQALVILLVLAAVGGGYAWYRSQAGVNAKRASNNGLVGYWSFDEGTGTQAGDGSGNGNTGTLTNMEAGDWTDGRLGKALSFDGVNEYVTMGDIAAAESISALTVAAWIKPGGTMTDNRGIVAKRSGSGQASWSLTLDLSGQYLYFRVETGNGQFNVFSGTTAITDQSKWYHVVAVYTGSQILYYVDGVADVTPVAASGTIVNTAYDVWVGAHYDPSFSWNGLIDEVRIYNRALSPTEITNLFDLGATKLNTTSDQGPDTGLVGYWSFDGKDISGTTAYDRSGQGNNGTLTNGPTRTIGQVGQAYSYNGSNQYIDVGAGTNLAQSNFTVSLWANLPASVPQANVSLLGRRSTSPASWQDSNYILNLFADSSGTPGRIDAAFVSGTNTVEALSSVSDLRGRGWSHVVFSYDGTNQYIYVNGIEEGRRAAATPRTGGSQVLNIARDPNDGAGYSNGSLDEVRIYNRALTSSEIKNLYDLGQSDKMNSASTQPQGGNRLDSGLAGYWKFDEGTGTSAADASVNANTGTLVNSPSWTTGMIGGALSFADASNNYVQVPSATNINLGDASYSISAWVYLTAYNTSWNSVIYAQDATNGFDIGITGTAASPAGRINYHVLFPDNAAYGGTALSLNAWHHTVVTYDNAAQIATLYLDGRQDGRGSVPRTNTPVIGDTFLGTDGRTGNQGQYTPDGKLDEIRLYKRVLSPEEVADLYRLTAPTGTDTSLKGYWSFNGKDIVGTTAYDRSGAGNNGTLVNNPSVLPGKIGQALLFNGTSQYINAGSSASLDNIETQGAGGMSVVFWAKPRVSSGGLVFDKGYLGTAGWAISIGWNGRIEFNHDYQTTTLAQWSQEGACVAGEWCQIILTWDGSASASNVKIYSNGTEQSYQGTQNGVGTKLSDASSDLGIGGNSYGYYFDGAIDDARIYSRVLSPDEIRGLYNAGR